MLPPRKSLKPNSTNESVIISQSVSKVQACAHTRLFGVPPQRTVRHKQHLYLGGLDPCLAITEVMQTVSASG
jgi:hypothetical protein